MKRGGGEGGARTHPAPKAADKKRPREKKKEARSADGEERGGCHCPLTRCVHACVPATRTTGGGSLETHAGAMSSKMFSSMAMLPIIYLVRCRAPWRAAHALPT